MQRLGRICKDGSTLLPCGAVLWDKYYRGSEQAVTNFEYEMANGTSSGKKDTGKMWHPEHDEWIWPEEQVTRLPDRMDGNVVNHHRGPMEPTCCPEHKLPDEVEDYAPLWYRKRRSSGRHGDFSVKALAERAKSTLRDIAPEVLAKEVLKYFPDIKYLSLIHI